jgi:hypothetical protein
MLDFKTNFERTQQIIRQTIIHKQMIRVMELQKRAKIKPSALNPVLLNTVSQRGY